MAFIKRVLVTGADGRIGRDLLPRLERSQFRVRGLDRQVSGTGAKLIQCDLGDQQGLQQAFRGMHAIVHLGGHSWEGDFHRALLPDNLAGCFNVFEAACATGVRRVVFASTSHVLGDVLTEEWRELAGIEISTSANEDHTCPSNPKNYPDPGQLEKTRQGLLPNCAKSSAVQGGDGLTRSLY